MWCVKCVLLIVRGYTNPPHVCALCMDPIGNAANPQSGARSPPQLHPDHWSRTRGRGRRVKVSVQGMERSYTWRHPLRPMLTVLRVMGRVPYYTDESDGSLKFSVLSGSMVWAVVVNSALILLAVSIYYWKITTPEFWMTFDNIFININELIVLSSCLHGPTASWGSTLAIVKAVNRWERYHRTFYVVTKRRISSTFLKHSYVGPLIMIFPSMVFLFQNLLAGRLVSQFDVVKEVVYIICFYYIYIVFWTWIVVCALVKKSAELLQINLVQSTATLATPEMFSAHRTLWLELHACAVDLVSALALTLLTWKILLFTIVVFVTYGMIVSLRTTNSDLIFAMMFGMMTIHFIGYWTYSCGSFAQRAMSQEIISAMVSRRWSNLSRHASAQLDLLLDSMAVGQPCFDIRGLFIFNRSTHITMFELLLTYLVVLVQLKEQSTT